ncbi:unnamed protein product, partial [Sphagnum balticum]
FLGVRIIRDRAIKKLWLVYNTIWYNTLANVLVKKLGFRALKQEPCIFINKAKDLIICVYVDDLAVISPDINIINSFITKIKEYFNIKELGLIKDYL